MTKTTYFYYPSTCCLYSVRIKTVTIWLDDLSIKIVFLKGFRPFLPKTTAAGDSMRINNVVYARGVGVQAISVMAFYLNGHARQFSAVVGVDDRANKNISAAFYVIADRKIVFASGPMQVGDQPKIVHVTLDSIKRLGLLVTSDVDTHPTPYANWANARLEMDAKHEPEHIPNSEFRYILTPKTGVIAKDQFGSHLWRHARPSLLLCDRCFRKTSP